MGPKLWQWLTSIVTGTSMSRLPTFTAGTFRFFAELVLAALLNTDGTLEDLNGELARRIASGAVDLGTPGVAEHLWAVTLAKLAVDQPGYSGYRAALADRASKET